MQVNLEQNEVAALLNALDSYIPQLREEIGKTENYDYREQLKAQEAMLSSLIIKLGGSAQGSDIPGVGIKQPPWGG